MFLPTNRPTRRQFLERSVLGAGSVLLSSVLLESCMTDHILPPPSPGPPLFDPKFDWNDKEKIVVISLIGMIPEVGDILGVLTDLLWPKSNEDVWGEIKDQVEALIGQAIADNVYQQVSEDLKGLDGSLAFYMNAIKLYNQSVKEYSEDSTKPKPDPTDLRQQWNITRNLFAVYLPHFQSSGYNLLLLPLFGQFANLYLALLRDMVLNGKTWGMSDAEQQQVVTDLKNSITNFTNYTNTVYTTYKVFLGFTQRNDHLCEPFKTVNSYVRQMTLTVLDFMDTWPYYDVTLYPTGTKVVLNREIFSDPMGTCDNSGPINIVYPSPTQFPTQLSVWGGDRINSVQVTYPAGSGPGGVTTTPRMGAGGGTAAPPYGGIFNLSPNNPIIAASATSGDIVNALKFLYADRTYTATLGGGYVDPDHNSNDSGVIWIGYPNEALSRVHINGQSNFYYSADCVVFGFQYWTSPAATLKTIRTIYINSPKERSAADFAKEFPTLGISAGLITDELKEARLAHWAYIDARAKALK